MTETSFVFSRCPNCKTRPVLGRRTIYRCRACMRFCCDKCMVRGFFLAYCPHCGARAALDPVGQTGYLI